METLTMEAIRAKDKIFLATFIPIVLAVAYVYFWRIDAHRGLEALRAESATLVRAEDFDFEKTAAARRLKAAEEALAAERKIPLPAVRVRANAADGVAARELAVLAVFRDCALTVGDSRLGEAKNPANGDALRSTGTCPAPTLRVYELAGGFAAVVRALRTFAAREMAVIPESVEMMRSGNWKVSLWL